MPSTTTRACYETADARKRVHERHLGRGFVLKWSCPLRQVVSEGPRSIYLLSVVDDWKNSVWSGSLTQFSQGYKELS